MDQQQLQIARVALWHQTAAADPSAPLRTFDEAAQWLDDIGFCLFLPRHTQLPAPAPSFVEACLGAASVTPAPDVIRQAAELLARLVGERRIVPLNLLGTFSEQPDFLVTPEMLSWVAAVRGDRQWKTAPGGRTAPIVVRTFEALDREGELTATQVREILGHEISEAAALRALMELWTGLRAIPIAAQGEPARWTLLKNRFAAQLATASNTAQTTALSALLSLYLRSAVAATAEEAEVFLSPLTARSRIREVLHGMMATRQLGTTSVASQTLLFVEGSLPETAPAPEPQTAVKIADRPAAGVAPKPRARKEQQPPARRETRPPMRKGPRPTRWELPAREPRPQPGPGRPWQKKPAAADGAQDRPQPGSDRPRREERRPKGGRPGLGRAIGQRASGAGARPGSGEKPWQRRPDRNRTFGNSNKPWERRPGNDRGFRKPTFGAENREGSTERPQRQERPPREERPPRQTRWRDRRAGGPPFGEGRKQQEGRPWRERPASRGTRPASGGVRSGPPKAGGGQRSGRPERPFRPGKSFAGKTGRPEGRGSGPRQAGPPKNKFRKPFPGKRKPRKNNQKEIPE